MLPIPASRTPCKNVRAHLQTIHPTPATDPHDKNTPWLSNCFRSTASGDPVDSTRVHRAGVVAAKSLPALPPDSFLILISTRNQRRWYQGRQKDEDDD